MSMDHLIATINYIVENANSLRKKHTSNSGAKLSYCAIFCQDEIEFSNFNLAIAKNSVLANDTATGPVYVVDPIETKIGMLRIVKIRRPDPSRTERGDADFALTKWYEFKKKYIEKPGFSLISRKSFDMIELVDPKYNVRAYFSNPPVEKHAGIKEALQGKNH